MDATIRRSYRFCGEVARREAKNFYYSFLLLPPARRRSMCALYAFLRHTDDLADEPNSAGEKAAALDRWRFALNLLGEPSSDPWPGWPALAHTVGAHSIPIRLLHEVIDGVAMDVHPRRFRTFEELHGYCYRVASVVGLSCIHVWGFRSDGGLAEKLAEDYGIALQLTNILRDVREDARLGRVYLPEEDLRRFGVSEEDLAADRLSPSSRALFEFQGRRASNYYDRAAPLVSLVSPVGRPVLRAIVGIYRALLDEIARRDWDVLGERVALSPWRKAAISVKALAGISGAKPIPVAPE